MTCPYCQQLPHKTIETPADLNQIIVTLKEASRKGVIQPIGITSYAFPFKELGDNHWNDSVSNYFACQHCKQYFYLCAETYHGSGGRFEAVETLPDDMEPDGQSFLA